MAFPVEGGKGYIVNVAEDTTITFTGAAWSDEIPVEKLSIEISD